MKETSPLQAHAPCFEAWRIIYTNNYNSNLTNIYVALTNHRCQYALPKLPKVFVITKQQNSTGYLFKMISKWHYASRTFGAIILINFQQLLQGFLSNRYLYGKKKSQLNAIYHINNTAFQSNCTFLRSMDTDMQHRYTVTNISKKKSDTDTFGDLLNIIY